MSNLFPFVALTGATPIDPDEMHDLIPDYISTMGELNEMEQANIADAYLWAEKQDLDELLTASFILKAHKQMFSQVWRWAGTTRRSMKSIGIPKEEIMNSLGVLLKDVEYWISHQTYSKEEIAARFHHRLVQIHLFPNGNGRHARLVTELLQRKIGIPQFTWGVLSSKSSLAVEGETRSQYIASLKAADNGDFIPLLKFVKS